MLRFVCLCAVTGGRADVPPVVRKTATVSVAGRGGAWASGAPKRVEVDARPATQANKKSREKPLPSSVDEMPKLEERSTKVPLGFLLSTIFWHAWFIAYTGVVIDWCWYCYVLINIHLT